jgi:predicted protein tyrosine phosphatase
MPWIANRGEGWVEQYTPEPETVCISITEPIGPNLRRDAARLPKGFVDVLRLQFQDYDPIGPTNPDGSILLSEGRKCPLNAVLMSKSQAAQVARFARKHRGRNILVHCAAGISRSGAVVDALLEAFPEYEDKGWPRHPNGHVRSAMKRALGLVPIGAEE